MITGIVYTSNSGYTAQYARLLGAAPLVVLLTGSRWVVPNPQMAAPAGSWLMAGKLQGYEKAKKQYTIRAACAVGMGPASQANADKLHAALSLPADVPVFTLQGGFDIRKLRGPYKWIMTLKCKQIRKTLEGKDHLSAAQQLTYDMATTGASAVSAENLAPIITWYEQTK